MLSFLRSALSNESYVSEQMTMVVHSTCTDKTGDSYARPDKECQFDSNPTDLFQYLERRDYEQVKNMLSVSPVTENKNDHALAIYEQANTWIIRKQNDEILWRVLPLHFAIVVSAPHEVISMLIELSPMSPSEQDDSGMLPIHIAYRNNAREDIIGLLLTVYPQSISVKDNLGKLPHDHAKKRGQAFSIYSRMKYAEYKKLSQNDMKIINQTLDVTLHEMQESHTSLLRKAREMHQDEINRITMSHSNELGSLKNKLDDFEEIDKRKKQEIVDSHKSQLKIIQVKHKSEIECLMDQHANDIMELNKKIYRADLEMAKLLKREKEYNNGMKAKIKDALKKAEGEIETICTDRDELRERVGKLRDSVTNVQHLLADSELIKRVTQDKLVDMEKRLEARDLEIEMLKQAAHVNASQCNFLPWSTLAV